MIVCPECGSRNEDGEQFCGACGTYLVWDATGATTADAPEPAPPAPAPVEVPTPQPEPEPDRGEPPVLLDEPGREAPEPPAPVAPDPVAAPGPPAAAAPAAAALLATPPPPPAPSFPPAQQTGAVRPGVPKAAGPVRTRRADEPAPAPGDLVCGSCGAGNADSRKFCRLCGASLADARVQPRRSWWSRFWRPDPRPGPSAGYRPALRRRRFPRRPVVAVLVVGALVALALSFRPELERARIALMDRMQGNVAVNPTTVVASSELQGRPAGQARDGATNLAWSPAVPGDGVGQFLDMPFAEPFRLTRVLVVAGASDVEKDYLAGSSPQVLTLVAVTAAGTQQVVEIPLEDRVGLQSAEMGIDDVVAVRLAISSTYRANPQTHVAIAEVEFRGRT